MPTEQTNEAPAKDTKVRLADYAAQAVFGASDGMTAVLGVMLPLAALPSDLVKASIGVSIAGAIGMGAGEWLSSSNRGLIKSVVMGLTTGAATLAPALPFVVVTGPLAFLASAVIVVTIAALVAGVRRITQNKSMIRAATETFGLLGAVALVVGFCALFLGGA